MSRILTHPFRLSGYACLALALFTQSASAQTLLWSENFDGLQLEPNFDETTIDDTAFTHTPPAGWTNTNGDDLEFTVGGVEEWRGWSFADPQFWAAIAGQRRDEFTRGQNVIAVADSDEFDDIGNDLVDNGYATFLTTPQISVSGVAESQLFMRFDSSWRPEAEQTATITATYDGGAPVEVLRFTTGGDTAKPDATNETLIIPLDNPTGANNVSLEFGYFDSHNNWWWAVDNLAVFDGEPQIFDEMMKVLINRDTGNVSLINNTEAEVPTKGYQIVSAAGALLETEYQPLADSDPNWIQLSRPGVASDLSEGHLTTGAIAQGAQLNLGNAWLKYPEDVNDVDFEYLDENGDVVEGAVEFTGNNSTSYIIGDLNFDNTVNIADWLQFKDGVGQNLSGLSAAQGYVLADLNGDQQHSPADFILFERAFDLANGAGAFAAIAAVPEPATWMLLTGMLATVLLWRSRSAISGRPLAIATAVLLTFGASARAQLVILNEDFDSLQSQLQPAINEAIPPEILGWTHTPPPGWSIDNGANPGDRGSVPTVGDPANGMTEWEGWSFTTFGFWTMADGQRRSEFSRQSNVFAVADPDEWDDRGQGDELGSFNSYLDTPAINLTGLPADSLTLQFDSSWRPESDNFDQTAVIEVSYDGGAPQEVLRWTSSAGPDFHPDETNEFVEVDLNNPAGASEMQIAFGLVNSGNDWWWAIDNLEITVPANPLQLMVNRASGDVSIKSNDTVPFPINSYSITSESGALDAAGWQQGNFDAQNLDGEGGGGGNVDGDYDSDSFVGQGDIDLVLLNWGGAADPAPQGWTSNLPGGNVDQDELDAVLLNWGQMGGGGGNPGEGWEVLTGGGDQVFEAFLLGHSTFADFREESIGSAFTPGGQEDLMFSYSTIFGQEQFGEVIYVDGVGGASALPEPSSLALTLLLAALGTAYMTRRYSMPCKLTKIAAVLCVAVCVGHASFANADGLLLRHYMFGEDDNASAGQNVFISNDSVTFGTEDEDLLGGSAEYVNLSGGRTGLGADFDGSGDFLEAPALNDPSQSPSAAVMDLGGLTSRGFQFWARPDGTFNGSRQDVVMDTDQHGVYISPSGTWGFTYGGQDHDSGVDVGFGDWAHIQLNSFNGPGASFYLDGEAIGAANGTYNLGRGVGTNPWTLVVGANSGDNFDIFPGDFNNYDGEIDDLKMSAYGQNGSVDATFNFAADNDIAAGMFAGVDPADVNLDGNVAGNGMGPAESDDVTAFVEGWMTRNELPGGGLAGDINTRLSGDLNFDGVTDIADWGILNLASPAAGAAALSAIQGAGVPEPGTLLLLSVFVVAASAAEVRRRSLHRDG